MKKHKQKYRSKFWKRLPVRAYLLFLLSVFFSFSIFGFAEDLLQNLSNPVQVTLIWSIYSGCVAVGYAFSFTKNLKALIFVIIFQVVLILVPWPNIFANAYLPAKSSKLIFDAVCIYFGVILGYIFFIRFITREGIKQIQLKTEMDLAEEMHDVLVPSIQFNSEKFEVYGKSNPASEIGGDLIDLFKNNEHITAYIADVSGHGINAGLLMGMFKSALYSGLDSGITLTELINKTNKTLHKLKKPNMFVTGSMIRFYPDFSLEYLTAGHLPILFFNKQLNKVEHLLIKQIPITVKEDFSFSSRFVNYSAGDIFVLLTDGLTEVMDKKGRQFGIDKIEKILIDNCNENAKRIFDYIFQDINKFGEQKDDQSAIIIKSI